MEKVVNIPMEQQDFITTLNNGVIKFSDKEKFLKFLLQLLKENLRYNIVTIKFCIHMARAAGYDYPEFKAIEKSMNSLKEEFEEEDLHRIKDYINVTNMSGTRRIKFADKEEFIKFLLRRLKNSDPDSVMQCIRMSRAAGYDYPEFKVIEKSVKSFKDR